MEKVLEIYFTPCLFHQNFIFLSSRVKLLIWKTALLYVKHFFSYTKSLIVSCLFKFYKIVTFDFIIGWWKCISKLCWVVHLFAYWIRLGWCLGTYRYGWYDMSFIELQIRIYVNLYIVLNGRSKERWSWPRHWLWCAVAQLCFWERKQTFWKVFLCCKKVDLGST